MRVGYLYPWDVVGDPAAAGRIAGWGFDTVALATAYHGVRAATPRHPAHRTVITAAALHRPAPGVVEHPGGPAWTDDPDPVATAAGALEAAGVAVRPWIVLTHSSTVGTRRPDWTAVSALGDRYPWALCPSHPDVRAHAGALTAAALAGRAWAGVVLEALGPMGAVHGGLHEKTDAYDAATWELLSVCCCVACATAQRSAGADPAVVARTLRAAVLSAAGGPAPRAADALGDLAAPVLSARHAGTAALVDRVLGAVADARVDGPVHVHGTADPWATGASPAVTAAVAAVASDVVVPAWRPGAPLAAPPGVPVAAYVTVLPPTDPAALPAHRAALAAAGAADEHVYHLGLVPQDRVALLTGRNP